MSPDLRESDWKTLSRLKPLALDRLCGRILREVGGILGHAQTGGYYPAYLDLFKHIQTSDETLADCFNDWRRSRALETLLHWRLEGLLSDEEFDAFSPETRAKVELFLKLR